MYTRVSWTIWIYLGASMGGDDEEEEEEQVKKTWFTALLVAPTTRMERPR